MNGLALWCFGTLLLVLSNITHAQAYPCSGPGPGEVVVGQTPASNGVASMPLCQRVDQGNTAPQAPPEKWESRWGAIVTDADKGVVGAASNEQSQDAAENAAISDCHARGGSKCKVEASYANSCGAVVTGGTGYNVGHAPTLDQTTKLGIKTCQKAGATDCRVYYTTCSPAVRIQ